MIIMRTPLLASRGKAVAYREGIDSSGSIDGVADCAGAASSLPRRDASQITADEHSPEPNSYNK
jgi:hypothetical protein